MAMFMDEWIFVCGWSGRHERIKGGGRVLAFQPGGLWVYHPVCLDREGFISRR
jgi:hypothetical protein